MAQGAQGTEGKAHWHGGRGTRALRAQGHRGRLIGRGTGALMEGHRDSEGGAQGH